MTETDDNSFRHGQGNGLKCARSFRRKGQQDRIITRDRAQLQDVLWGRITHPGGRMRAVKTRLSRKERAFDVPAGDSTGQLRRL